MAVHVLIGGTGTLGNALARVLQDTTTDKVRVVARNEGIMSAMRRRFADDRFSFIIADARDEDRIRRVLSGATHVYHMAALKHVHTCEYDVLEAVKTNVEGTANVVRACIDARVEKAVLVSTDKAVEPTTSYGAMKMVAERSFLYGNSYSGSETKPLFYCVRYGNVLGSTGSVVQLWQDANHRGNPITVADPDTTRFWWTSEDAANFIYRSMDYARRGDILIPFMDSCSLGDLAEMVAPGCRQVRIDGYSTEKTHEVLLAPYETKMATYVSGFNAVRVSYLLPLPADEMPWGSSQLNSQDHVDLRGVARCLTAQ
jgi:UDP-N-acetylglucosamine 4,6-dehydratase/5-epimerase